MDSRCPNCRVELNARGCCPRCSWPRFTGRLSGVLTLIAGLLCLYGGLGYYFQDSLSPFLQQRQVRTQSESFPYEVSYPPPPVPPQHNSRPQLDAQEKQQLREFCQRPDYPALNAALERYQEEYTADSSNEERIIAAFNRFEYPEGSEPMFANWIAQTPDHFAPYLARGIYYVNRGFESRGGKWASETSEDQFRKMRDNFNFARVDLRRALELNPRLLPAYIALLRMAGSDSDETKVNKLIARGQKLFPDSYQFYATALNFKKPRWGGSYEEMEALATQAVVHVESNPKLYRLFGIIYADQVDRLYRDNDYARAIEYGQKGLAFGDFTEIHYCLARSYLAQQNYAAALPAFDRALQVYITDKDCLVGRANCHFRLGNTELALADMQRYLALYPQDPIVIQWSLERQQELASPEQEVYRQALIDLAKAAAPPTVIPTMAVTKQKPAAALKIKLMFHAPNGAQPSGLEWHKQRLYLSSYMKNPGIFRLDPRSGAVEQIANPDIVWNNSYGGLASDGRFLYHIQSAHGFPAAKLSLETLEVREKFTLKFKFKANSPGSQLSDFAYCRNALYAISQTPPGSSTPMGLYRFSLAGDMEQVFAFPYGEEQMFLLSVASDGHWLWICAGDRLVKVDPTNGNIVADYPLSLPQHIRGLAWDGKQLWAAAFSGEIFTLKPM